MNRRKIRQMVNGGLLAALIALMTAAIKLPVPATGGYVHPGDAAIFLAAYLMGPWAAVPAALGSALADILGGYAVYALPTALIKGAMGWIAGKMLHQEKNYLRILAFLICSLVMVAGYFVFEYAMYGLAAALGAMIPNLIQAASGIVLGGVLCRAGKGMRRG